MATSDAVPIPWAEGYFVDRDGHIYSNRMGRMRRLAPWKNSKGYQIVHVRDGSLARKHLVHRIVARVFIGEPEPGQECCHIDGDVSNNSASNLRWDTHSGNMRDTLIHGTHVSIAKPWRMPRGERHGSRTKPERVPRGEQNGSAVLSTQHVIVIREMSKLGMTCSGISRALEVPRGAVKCILQGKTWRHVGELANG